MQPKVAGAARQRYPSRSLANLLLTHNPTVAFNPSVPGAPSAAGRGSRRLLHRTARGGSPVASVDLGSSFNLADAAAAVAGSTGSQRLLTEEATKVLNGEELGWWDSYIKLVEDGIISVHDFLNDVGVPGAYGLSIISFVLLAKTLALPLNWKQYASTAQMKAMKPQQDLVKKWFGDNKDMLNIQLGVLFDKFDVNPLAGCLPSFAQIPIFLGVYYSVTSIAKAKVFEEGFLWIPNLSGPIADRKEGLSWLTEGWVNDAPKLGWHDTLCYLSIPLILICSQTMSLYLLGTFEALESAEGGGSTKATANVLKLLPFFLGWVAANAPSGLGLYWICNNILTTVQTVAIKKVTAMDELTIDVDLDEIGPRRDPLPDRKSVV